MSEAEAGDRSTITALQARITAAMRGKTRAQVSAEAQDLAYRIWGPTAPLIDERKLRDIQERLQHIPQDGKVLRAILAVLDIPLVEALSLMGYWSDLMLEGASAQRRLEYAFAVAGLRARITNSHGGTVVIEIT